MTTPETNSNPEMKPSEAIALYNRIVKQTEEVWDNWVKLGTWIYERHQIASKKAGGGSTRALTPHLKKSLGSFYPIYQKLNDVGVIGALLKCIENLGAVTMWRETLPEGRRVSSPKRVWAGYQAALRAIDLDAQETALISDPVEEKGSEKSGNENDEDDEDDEDEDEDDEDDAGESKRRRSTGKERESELLAEIAALQEQYDETRMTIYPEINAQRIWRGLVNLVGADKAGPLMKATCEEGLAVSERVTEAIDLEGPPQRTPMFDA